MLRIYTLPPFALAAGITQSDIAAMHGEVQATPFAIRSVQRDADGEVTGMETMLGVKRFAFTPGGTLGLFAAPRTGNRNRLLLAQGPFQAICAAAVENHRPDTVYAAPPGRWIPRATQALVALIRQMRITHVVLGMPLNGSGNQLAASALDLVMMTFAGSVTVEAGPPRSGSWSQELCDLRRRAA